MLILTAMHENSLAAHHCRGKDQAAYNEENRRYELLKLDGDRLGAEALRTGRTPMMPDAEETVRYAAFHYLP